MLKPYKLGIIAEYYIQFLYVLKGYKLLARRYKSYLGEIDLILIRKNTIVFIEVKARRSKEDITNYDLLSNILSSKQQQRIVRSAQNYIAKYPSLGSLNLRFDLAIVQSWFNVRIISNITQY